jgi:hypothetical protein
MIFILSHPEARARAIKAVQEAAEGWVVRISEPRRNLEQSAKFHAICGDLEKLGVQWAGKARTAENWKVLLVSGHAMATKEGAEIVPGLENEFVSIRESTALMSKSRASSLIEYSLAFLANQEK